MEELSKPENRSKIKKLSKCNQHPNKKLKYHCETCDQLICRHCMDFDHDKQHKFSPLEQAAQSKREKLKKNCEFLEIIVVDSNSETQVFKKDIESLNNNFDQAQRLINERKEQLFAAKVDKKTNSMIDKVRQIFDRKTRNIEEEINRTETFVNRIKGSADMARSLLQNGNDEEIIRSYQSVQENVNNAIEKGNQKSCGDDDAVLSSSSDEIDTMLLEEVKDSVKEKDALRAQVMEAATNNEQWFSTNEGFQHLQLLVQYFQQAGITPEMSRDTITQDMKFGLSGGYCLDFPTNFPKRMPTLRAPDGMKYDLNKIKFTHDEDVCATLVRTVTEFLRNPPQSSRHGRGGRW